MKFFSVYYPVFLLAPFVSATVPQCARPCVSQALHSPSSPCKNSISAQCICTNKALISTLSCCVYKNCDEAGAKAALKFAKGICGAVDASGNLPSMASCPSSTGSTMMPSTTSGSSGSSQTSGAAAVVNPHDAAFVGAVVAAVGMLV